VSYLYLVRFLANTEKLIITANNKNNNNNNEKNTAINKETVKIEKKLLFAAFKKNGESCKV